MQNDNGKKQIKQFPNQVVAVNEFRKFIESYFEMNSLSEVNRMLIEMLSASTGPDPRSGKHTPINIANALYDVNNIINLVTHTKPLANEKAFQHYAKNISYELQAVGNFDIAHLSEWLYFGLNAYIFQDEDFEGISLAFANEIISAYKKLYDWFNDAHEWINS
ncbi:hypothetical protein [Pedobacter sp. R20-19]|uniref:hypothetical protein n=1 Tax=Pedobacter sp. R20-19 TaxID=1270196 RepID=UPI00049369ED|nr:hypothetical protein [Pedobacter sp. R20-19]